MRLNLDWLARASTTTMVADLEWWTRVSATTMVDTSQEVECWRDVEEVQKSEACGCRRADKENGKRNRGV